MSNVFRKEYRELSDNEKMQVETVKRLAESLYEVMENQPSLYGKNARMIALAKTKLEESVMWAVKAITE